MFIAHLKVNHHLTINQVAAVIIIAVVVVMVVAVEVIQNIGLQEVKNDVMMIVVIVTTLQKNISNSYIYIYKLYTLQYSKYYQTVIIVHNVNNWLYLLVDIN